MSNRKTCRGCIFYRPLSAGHEMACHYMLMTGEKGLHKKRALSAATETGSKEN